MKTLKKYSLIIALVLMTGYVSAATFNTLEIKEVTISEAEYEAIANKIFNTENDRVVEKQKACCKIYNSKLQLVYMSRDENDAHLKQLRQYCNLIMKTESSSYYLLADHR